MWLRTIYYLKKTFEILEYSSHQLSEFQDRRIEKMIEVGESISYYQELWPENVNVEDKKDLEKLPKLESELFRKQQNEMDKLTKEGENLRRSSGTTGDQVRVKFDDESFEWLSAVYARSIIKQGYSPRQRISQYWREVDDNRTFLGRYLMPINFIESDSSLDDQIEALSEQDPDVIKYFPQMLLAICKKLESLNGHSINPDLILTYGEVLTPSTKEYIEETFEAPVFDQYATTEFGLIGWECSEGGYHINEDTVYSEISEFRGNEVDENGIGELILTGLVNNETPLIRYEIGDIVETSKNPCSCNTSFKRIKRILGRKEDVIHNSDNEMVFPSQIADIVAPYQSILFFQLSADNDRFRLKYVPSEEFNENDLMLLLEDLRSNLCLEPIDSVEVNQIPRSQGGKLEIIENNQSIEEI